MCNCHSILECRVMFSGVKLSIRSFNLLLADVSLHRQERPSGRTCDLLVLCHIHQFPLSAKAKNNGTEV